MDEPRNEIALMNPAGLMKVGGGLIYCSLDLGTPEGRMNLFKMRIQTDKLLKDVVNMPLAVTDLIVYPREVVDDETGEVSIRPVIAFLCEDGEAYYTWAHGVRECLPLLALIRGNPPWHPPYILRAKLTNLKSGRQWMTLEPVQDAASGHTKAKK